jgi:hypothetical protein
MKSFSKNKLLQLSIPFVKNFAFQGKFKSKLSRLLQSWFRCFFNLGTIALSSTSFFSNFVTLFHRYKLAKTVKCVAEFMQLFTITTFAHQTFHSSSRLLMTTIDPTNSSTNLYSFIYKSQQHRYLEPSSNKLWRNSANLQSALM